MHLPREFYGKFYADMLLFESNMKFAPYRMYLFVLRQRTAKRVIKMSNKKHKYAMNDS